MTAAGRENTSFTQRCITQAQRLSIDDPFCQALNDYLLNHGRIAWDDERALFWVIPPNGPPQVAVWLMDIALLFQPRDAFPTQMESDKG